MSSALLSSLSGPEKAAVLLLCLGSEESARLLSSMSPREAGLLAGHLAQAREVDADTRRRVLEEFKQATCDAQPRRLDGAAGGRLPNTNSHRAAGLYARAQTETLSQSAGAAAEKEPDDGAVRQGEARARVAPGRCGLVLLHGSQYLGSLFFNDAG